MKENNALTPATLISPNTHIYIRASVICILVLLLYIYVCASVIYVCASVICIYLAHNSVMKEGEACLIGTQHGEGEAGDHLTCQRKVSRMGVSIILDDCNCLIIGGLSS